VPVGKGLEALQDHLPRKLLLASAPLLPYVKADELRNSHAKWGFSAV
jgi:hypothetical protein